jgi:O-antigen ligase/polysaccharide polymerase Wzy-like membrane protein
MITTKNNTYILLYFYLLTPIFAYIYTAILELPKNIIIASTFLFFIYGLLFIFERRFVFPNFLILLLVFAIYRFVWIQYLGINTHILTHIYYSILFFAILLAILIAYNISYTDNFITNTIFIFKAIIIITFIGSVIQVISPEFLNPRHYLGLEERQSFGIYHLYKQRRLSIFGLTENNALGLSFIPMLSILVGYLLRRKDQKVFIYLFLGIATALLSNGRYIMVGSFIVSLQIILYYKNKFVGVVKYGVSIIVILFFVYQILLNFGYDFSDWYETRLFAEGRIEQTTRYKAIGNFLRFFPQKPFLGTGKMTAEIRAASKAVGSSHIHVGYLSHLGYYGIIGCLFLFGFWFLFAKKLYKTAKATNYWGSFFAFLVFLWSFATMSQPSIFYPGLIFAFIFDKHFNDKHRTQEMQVSPLKKPYFHASDVWEKNHA